MKDLISREALLKKYCKEPAKGDCKNCDWFGDSWCRCEIFGVQIAEAPAVDTVEVVHGRWALETRSFYMDTFDESCELAVYILASCSECGRKHPDTHQVFSKTLYAPEGADDEFRFDQKAEQEKALVEFMQRGYNFATYCPNCGARMDGE